jgi:lipopolysaccharide/colanic/teichoic acid biosynthesis glycosyltransferase
MEHAGLNSSTCATHSMRQMNGISPQEAQQRVAQAEQQATQAAGQAEETARRAADTAASSASIAAFLIFAIMLLGAIASVLGARRGTRDLLHFRSARAI